MPEQTMETSQLDYNIIGTVIKSESYTTSNKAIQLLNEIQQETKEYELFIAELRHLLYKTGIAGSPEDVEAETTLIIDSMKIDEETNDDKITIKKSVRSALALNVFARMEKTQRDAILGMARAKYYEADEKILDKYSDESGELKLIINQKTPIYDLLSLIAAYETNPFNEKLKRIKGDAAEHLTRNLITRHENLIRLSTRYLSHRHYQAILNQMPDTLSDGSIGGKAGGVILGYAILATKTPDFDDEFAKKHNMKVEDLKRQIDLKSCLRENTSTFIGSRIFEQFIETNSPLAKTSELKAYYDDKQTNINHEDRDALHERINKSFESSNFPAHILRQLKKLFIAIHKKRVPIIVRSSSELEDKEGAAFAGKYVSVNLANQGAFAEDFEKFINAIKEVYKSVFSPDVMKYRKTKGLVRENEEMGILIQELNGKQTGKYYYPHFAAVAMSYSTQNPGGDPERGAASIVAGLGDTAVDKGGKFIMLSKPLATGITDGFSQTEVVVMNMETNEKETITSSQFLETETNRIVIGRARSYKDKQIINMQGLIEADNNNIPLQLEYIVQKLKYCLGYDVDCEFTIQYNDETGKFEIKLVQQRPQNIPKNLTPSKPPETVDKNNILAEEEGSLTSGSISNIKYSVYINPSIMDDPKFKINNGIGYQIKDWMSKINDKLENESYFIFSPKRWGSAYPGPGIPVSFSHFDNAKGFLEMFDGDDQTSFGRHFFQNVMESGMCTGTTSKSKSINMNFFDTKENSLEKILMEENIPDWVSKYIKVIDIEKTCKNQGKNMRMHIAANNVKVNGDNPKFTAYIAEMNKDMPIPLKTIY